MTELEKIAYAKSFIDQLANGINPLDGTPIPEGEVANNVRLSRCFFYVSDLLRQMMEIENGRIATMNAIFEKRDTKVYCESKEKKRRRVPFSLTPEEAEAFVYSEQPLSATAITRKINALAGDLRERNMERFTHRKINQWMLNLGLLEWRTWETGKPRLFPTAEGEAMGVAWVVWENYGRRTTVVLYPESVQRFIMDNLDAVLATEVKKNKRSSQTPDAEEAEEQGI
ncbi:MAG: hypothetical protein IJW29_08280 [Clostridia bacterium]|nr:hypothetical protein [Clostridia bacterium]